MNKSARNFSNLPFVFPVRKMTEDPREIVDYEQIVREAAKRSGKTIKEVSLILDAFLDAVSDELKNGKTVRLSDFGTFAIPKKKK